MRRKGRRRLRKVRGPRHERGGGVVHFSGNVGLPPLNVLDGGRDAPLQPMTSRQRWMVFGVGAGFCVVLAVVIALTV